MKAGINVTVEITPRVLAEVFWSMPDYKQAEFFEELHNVVTEDHKTNPSAYYDFKIDEPVMVRDNCNHQWERRYFAGIDDQGMPLVFCGGGTNWSSLGETVFYIECEELEG
jgi:hypothetical protein